MAGVKGRSGRRPWSVEEKRHRVIDKAWELTSERLSSDADDKYSTAKDIVIKDMVGKEQVDMNAHIIAKEEQSVLDKYIHTNRLQSIN